MHEHAARTRAQDGYSLIEALVVLAIIGIVSLVSVPNFVAMYRSAKVKAAVRNFTNDVRSVRQQAVTTYRPMMVSIGTTAAEQDSYWIYQWNPGTSAWDPVPNRVNPDGENELEEVGARKSVYFGAVGFADSVTADAADRKDIIFESNGSVRSPLAADPTIRIRTDLKVPKQEFLLTVTAAGTLRVQ